MYGKILVGVRDSEQGQDALALGRTLTQASGATMVVAAAPGKDGAGLAQLARAEGADLLVIGPTHRGPVGRMVPGSTAERLLGQAPCAVAIAPPGFGGAEGEPGWRPLSEDLDDSGLRVIGVGYDGTPRAAGALRDAAELAVDAGAALRVFAVTRTPAPLRPGPDSGELQTAAQQAARELRDELARAVAELPPEARAEGTFLRGFPAMELLAAAEKGVDLLVLGSRPGGPVRRALHGSVSSAVIEAARCPVLIVPAGVRARQAVPA